MKINFWTERIGSIYNGVIMVYLKTNGKYTSLLNMPSEYYHIIFPPNIQHN